MPKRRSRPRWVAPSDANEAFTPVIPRVDDPPVERDRSRQIDEAQLDSLLRMHEVVPAPWMFVLEARIGGVQFGESYSAAYLGFRAAFRAYFRTGSPAILARTPRGDPLLAIGVEGDTHYFVSTRGEAWAQDGIADARPHFETESFDGFALKMNWPEAVRAKP